MQSPPSPSSGIIRKLGSITSASLMNSCNRMHRLNELRLAGSVMNLTSTVPLVTVALNPHSSFLLLFFHSICLPNSRLALRVSVAFLCALVYSICPYQLVSSWYHHLPHRHWRLLEPFCWLCVIECAYVATL
jgi:hypothetical protein